MLGLPMFAISAMVLLSPKPKAGCDPQFKSEPELPEFCLQKYTFRKELFGSSCYFTAIGANSGRASGFGGFGA